MISEGYVYIKDAYRFRMVKVYRSIQELRLCCGEIPNEEIQKVKIVLE